MAAIPVPSFDPRPQNEPLLPEIKAAFARVLESGKFVGGEFVESFERAAARALDVPHAAAVSSGTDALLVALMALGIGPGDVVVTTPFTFFATAGSIRRAGALPAFADVDPATLCLSSGAVAELLESGRPRRPAGRVRALLPVHLFGRVADVAGLSELARRHELALVEDAAQAFGARADGRAVGGAGTVGCFSFYPTKNLGGVGDGGLVTTRDAALDRDVRRLRNHGQEAGAGGRDYEHAAIGGNFRLDALQCVALETKLPHVARWNAERVGLAQRYDLGLRAAGLEDHVKPPPHAAAGAHVYHQYVVRAERRDELRAFLAARSIGAAVYYPRPLHLQPCFRDLGYQEGDLPIAEQAAREVLALPIHPGLAPEQVDAVVAALAAFYGRGRG
jgi:dTDP-4-amino-4,6-dideoxygalactose transaminase